MVVELTKLYNTMMLIETKGESTKQMALCLNYLAGIIEKCSEKTTGETVAE